VAAECPVGDLQIGGRVIENRKALHQHEAAAAVERVHPAADHRLQDRQVEVVARELGERLAAGLARLDRAVELRDLRARQAMRPTRVGRDLLALPRGLAFNRLERKLDHLRLSCQPQRAAFAGSTFAAGLALEPQQAAPETLCSSMALSVACFGSSP